LSGIGDQRAQGAVIAGERQAGWQAAEVRQGEEAMSVYRRGGVWWTKFHFNGQVTQESKDWLLSLDSNQEPSG